MILARLVVAALVLGLGLALAGCALAPVASPPVAAPSVAAPSVVPAPGTAAASATAASPSAVISPSVSIVPAASPALPADPALLALLPTTLAGLDRQVDASVDADAFADPTLATIGTAGASAVYVDPGDADFAFATLIRLRGGSITDSSFRDYRDSFDRGACSQAGGVGGHAEAQIGGRPTFIGSCDGGVLTYHALLPSAHAILSISSAGSKRLGEQLAAAVAG